MIRNAGDVMWRGSLVIRPGTIDVAVQPPISTDWWLVEELDERISEVHALFERTLEQRPVLYEALRVAWEHGVRGDATFAET